MRSIPSRQFNIDAGLLSSVVLLGAFREASAAEEELPQELWLTGVVRDFQERTAPGGHPDFEQAPAHGFGHYAGNVAPVLGPDGKPVFTGIGRKISEQARDAHGRPIAAHLANRQYVSGGAAAAPTSCTVLRDSRGTDAYTVCLVSATFNDDGTSTWTYRVTELGATGRGRGPRDLSHWNLKLDPSHTVLPGTTPGHDLGVDGSTGFYGIKWDVTDGFDSGEFTIVLDGHYSAYEDPAGVLAKGGATPDTGSMQVPSATVSSEAGPFGTDGPGLVEAEELNDSPATLSNPDTGGITSATTFNQWYRDELGVNMSAPLPLRFQRQADGTYVFDDAADEKYAGLGGFFPIEDRLLGNSGGSGPDRNFHFTFELHTNFNYDADGNQFFRFVGDDDVWVFIDGKLAIDLGGVHAATEQYIDLSRLGLIDGERYSLDFFFAERHRTQSNCRIETNLCLETSPETALPSITAAFD